MRHSISQAIEALTAAVTALIRQPVPLEDTPDAMGLVRFEEVRLADWRRGLMAETPGGTVGQKYAVEETRSATRTYNPEAILLSVLTAGSYPTLTEAIKALVAAKALRLEWSWTGLKAFLHAQGVSLRLAAHPLSGQEGADGDHVGETWKSESRIVGVKEEKPA